MSISTSDGNFACALTEYKTPMVSNVIRKKICAFGNFSETIPDNKTQAAKI